MQRRIDWRMSADGAAGTDVLLRRPVLCFSGTSQEEFAFAGVGGERGGAGKFVLGFGEAAELDEEVAADGGEQVVIFKRRLGG